jgi:hypothetical protein
VHSVAHRSVTVVTVLTLMFTPVLRGHHWIEVLTGKKVESHEVQCKPGERCPVRSYEVHKVVLPAQQP